MWNFARRINVVRNLSYNQLLTHQSKSWWFLRFLGKRCERNPFSALSHPGHFRGCIQLVEWFCSTGWCLTNPDAWRWVVEGFNTALGFDDSWRTDHTRVTSKKRSLGDDLEWITDWDYRYTYIDLFTVCILVHVFRSIHPHYVVWYCI